MSAITESTLERLRAELDQLLTVDLPAAREDIVHARSAGDSAENSDIFVALENEGRLLARVKYIESVLKQAADGGVAEVSTDSVSPGVVVSLDFGDGEIERYLVGSIEERPEGVGVLTTESPLGAALLGARCGDVVSYETPTGATLKVTLVDISAA